MQKTKKQKRKKERKVNLNMRNDININECVGTSSTVVPVCYVTK